MNIENEQKCVNMAIESAYAKGKKDAIEKACDTMESFMAFYGIDRDIMMRISKDIRKAMEK